MKKIFSFLTAILFVGSMWAAEQTITLNFYNESKISSTSGSDVTLAYVRNSAVFSDDTLTVARIITAATKSGTVQSGKNGGVTFGGNNTSAASWTITFENSFKFYRIEIIGANYESNNFTVNGDSGTGSLNAKGTKLENCTDTIVFTKSAGSEYYGEITFAKTQTKRGTIYVVTMYYDDGVAPSSDPAVSFVDGDTKAISSYELAAAGETDTWALAYSNIKEDSEGATPDVAVYSNAECTTEFTGDWFEAVADGANSVIYSAYANETGSTRTVYVVFSNTAKNASDGDVNLTDTLTVSQSSLVLVESVSVKAATELEVGETETLTVTVLPEGASDKTVTWESDKESVATVDENGKVTAVAPGKANITATANDGSGKSATCVVTVIAALEKSTLTFTDEYGDSGATADDGVVWTVESDAAESTYEAARGIHYGTNSKSVQYIELATSDITGTIKKVIVNAAANSDATVSVKVGGNAFGGDPQDLTNTANAYTFIGSAKGTIVVLIAKDEAAEKALYCKSIVVKYDDTTTAIDDTEAGVKAVKKIVNGQLLIEKNGRVYNAFGQTVK